MARPKTDFRNEMKTRVTDKVFDGVKQFQEENRIDSEARAISQLLELALYGTVGSIPQSLINHSHEMAQFGTKTLA